MGWIFTSMTRIKKRIPKKGYWPDEADRNQCIGQTEQTEIKVLARPNRQKLPLARRKARPKFFPDHWGQPIPVLGRGLHPEKEIRHGKGFWRNVSSTGSEITVFLAFGINAKLRWLI